MAVKPSLAAALPRRLGVARLRGTAGAEYQRPDRPAGRIAPPQGIVTYAFRLEPGRYRVMLTADPKAALVVYPARDVDEVPVPCADDIAATNATSGVASPAICDVTVEEYGLHRRQHRASRFHHRRGPHLYGQGQARRPAVPPLAGRRSLIDQGPRFTPRPFSRANGRRPTPSPDSA